MRTLRLAAATMTAAATAATVLATSPLALADQAERAPTQVSFLRGLGDLFGRFQVDCATGTGPALPGAGGGPNNPIPLLNGQNGAVPSLNGATRAIEHITGLQSPNNTVARFNVAGTDLGIMWDNGMGETLTAFGDTTGIAGNPLCQGLVGDWRSNVLLRSSNRNLANGMRFDSAPLDPGGRAREVLPSLKAPGSEFTVIPTSGISAPIPGGVRQYLSFMSVRSWDDPGSWTTNYSAIGYSDDNGETWHAPTFDTQAEDAQSIRSPGTPGNENFQMTAFTRSSDPADPYVYAFGTPAGRHGAARLSRVRQDSILNVASYQYWDGGGWSSGDPARAAVVIDGPVGELSVAWNVYLGKYVAMSAAENQGMVIRTADSLTGPWSEAHTLVGTNETPLYGGFMHPASNASGGPELYFLATNWWDYNVMLLRTDLTPYKN